MSEYEITRSLAPWKGRQSTSNRVVGSQRIKYLCHYFFGKLIFYMSEYEITRSLAPWKRRQSTSYLVVGSPHIKYLCHYFLAS